MAVGTPPYVLQGGSHPAATFRQIQQGLLGSPFGAFTTGVQATTAGGGHGVAAAPDLLVTQNGTPNMSVNVAAGIFFIRGTESVSQGVYGGCNDAPVNLAIAASDPTNPRIDLVVAKVRDSFYSGAALDVSFAVVTGTPAGSVPAVPANALVVCQIAVAATVTTILTAAITDKRTRATALGGIQECTSTTRPTGQSLYAGLLINEIDTGFYLYYTGAAWVNIADHPAFISRYVSSAAGARGVVFTDAAQTITTGTPTFITWGTYVSQDGVWSSGAINTLTVPAGKGGRYVISFTVTWSAGTTGGSVGIDINAALICAVPQAVGYLGQVVSITRTLAAGDTLQFEVNHSTGSDRTATSRLEIM